MTPSLLPPSAPPLGIAMEVASERIEALPIEHAKLWDPQNCPLTHLPWLAWAYSVDAWDPAWSEEQKRATVAAAFAVHRLKGTPAGLRTALAPLSVDAEITEWFEEDPPAAPHTFRVDVFGDNVFAAGREIDAAFLSSVTRIVNRVKPARTHFALRVGERFPAAATIRTGTRVQARDCVHHDVIARAA